MPLPPEHAPDDDLVAELRRHYEGVLLFDGHVAPVRFVVDDASGALVMMVEPVVLAAAEHTLFVPEEREDAVELMLSVAPTDAASGPMAAACDRWTAYHSALAGAGAARRAWASATIEGAKWHGRVYDAEQAARANPLAAAVGRLCRELNRDEAALSAACARIANVQVSDPRAVGVDPGGIDIRARFGIVRLEFDAPALTAEAAQAAIARLVGPGATGP